MRRDPEDTAAVREGRLRGEPLKLLTDDAFDRLFLTFQRTAFRLEVRDWYRSPLEAEALRKFVTGEPDDLAWLQEWLALVRSATNQGRQFQHVRVVSVPLTDYSRFGLWCAGHLNAAGEDIRYLARDRASGLPEHDFWLFDDTKLVLMHFDGEDQFLGPEIVENPAAVAQHRAWRDTAWRRAVRGEEFAAG